MNQDLNDTRDEHYLYIFGGIKIRNNDDIARELELYPELADTEISSYEYMGDLWRFNMKSNQWEDMEVYGIASIRREIFLWNGTRIFTEVPSSQKLKIDLNNIAIL